MGLGRNFVSAGDVRPYALIDDDGGLRLSGTLAYYLGDILDQISSTDFKPALGLRVL